MFSFCVFPTLGDVPNCVVPRPSGLRLHVNAKSYVAISLTMSEQDGEQSRTRLGSLGSLQKSAADARVKNGKIDNKFDGGA